jgi:Mg-chelatase subunit ChlD
VNSSCSSIRFAATAFLWLAFVASAAEDEGTGVRIVVESPLAGQPVANKVHQAPIRGNAFAEGDRAADFDIVLIIDVSGSTKVASGVDVDGDGIIGIDPHMELVPPGMYPPELRNTDPDDLILAAEIAAAEALLGTLDPEHTRLGVISFSGEMNPNTGHRVRFDQQDAWVEVPLTNDYLVVRRALQGILLRGPNGGTNFAAGIRLAVTELASLSGAKSAARPDAKKVALFLTDGLPTFPIGSGSSAEPGDTEAALNAARLAHKAGININTYALGPSALTNPIAATEVARITLGTFMPVQNPGDIISFLQGVTFANVEDVVFTNLTTREVSYDVNLSPDGRFSGFVPVTEGKNRVRVTALASDGSSGSVEFDLDFETAGLSSKELALELDRIRERNKHLVLLIERDRIQRFRAQQRKVIEFEMGPEAEAEAEAEAESGEAPAE